MRIIFLLFLASFASLYAQTMETTCEQKKKGGKLYWHLQGRTDIPSGAVLFAQLMAQGSRLGQSPGIRVKEGQFSYMHPITQPLPNGTYLWEIVFRKEVQPKALKNKMEKLAGFTHTHTFVLGTPHDRRKETHEEAVFYRETTREIERSFKRLRERTEAFLKNKASGPDLVKSWLDEIRSDLERIDEAIKSRSEGNVCLLESMKDLNILYSLLERLYKNCHLKLRVHYGITQIPGPNVEIVFKEYEDSFARISLRLLSGLPLPENFDESSLEEDLLWFNRIFADFSRHHRSTEEGAVEKWEERLFFWSQELDDFQEKAAQYENSPLAQRHPPLKEDIFKLGKAGKELLWSYTRSLYQKAGKAFPPNAPRLGNRSAQEILIELRDRFEKVRRIPLEKKEREEKEKKRLQALVKESVKDIQGARQKLEEGLLIKDISRFSPWREEFQKDLSRRLDSSMEWKKDFPKIADFLSSAAHCLSERLSIHERTLTGKMSPKALETSVAIRQCEFDFFLAFQGMEKETAGF